ncbi:MAG: FMN-binding protein [Candidatus Omnitrophica bacterium]|nr:FMN-binding protein [Candidatus Omnitrophota bacterium]MDD5488165.1 FMN-binding protein [Candidatus Omnitrophota bacterium]
MENKNIISSILGNEVVKIIVSLVAVGIVSGMALVYVYNYSMPKIKVNLNNETEKAIRTIFPSAKDIVKSPKEGVFTVKDASGKMLGYAFTAEGNGYQGVIKVLAGSDPGFTSLKGMEVLESQETPGLGAEINSDSFRGQFDGLDVAHAIEYVKNQKPTKPYEIEAITGATISSRAVVNLLNKRISELREAGTK